MGNRLASRVWHIAYYVLRITYYALPVVTLAACGQEAGAWPRIQESGVLRVGLDPSYPPFEVADDAGLRGLDVDLMNAVAADLGLETEFVYFGFDGLYDALTTAQVDVLASALVVAPGRMEDFAYTEPYFNAGQILIVPQTNTEMAEMADMNGRSLAVELGAQGHVEATTWQRRLDNLTIVPHNTADDALAAVSNGDADAALVDAISGRLYLANAPTLTQAPEPVTVEPFALVVRIEDEQLLRQLNESLTRLRQSGQLAQIIQRWLDTPPG